MVMTIRVNRDRVFHHVRNTDVLKIPAYRNLAGVGDEPGMEGDIILDRSTMQFCFHNGVTWICLTTVTLTDGDCDASLIIDGIGPFLEIRGLSEGPGIVLTEGASCVTIATDITLSDACGTGVSLVNDGTGPDLAVKGLVEGDGIVLTSDASCVTIATDITLSDACGTGVSLVNNSVGPDLAVKGLVEGDGIVLTSDASCVTIGTPFSRISLTGGGATILDITTTDVIWDSVVDDVGTDLTFNGTDTINILTSGVYIFDSTLAFVPDITGSRGINFGLGAVLIAGTVQSATPAFEWRGNVSIVRTVIAPDTFKVSVFQSSGGDLTLTSQAPINNVSVTRLI